jgi:hypothetical protein
MAVKLVRVALKRKGLFVLMAESEARARGFLPPLPEVKALPPPRNKARRKAESKVGE